MIEAAARALGLQTATRTFLLAAIERPEHRQLLERAITARAGMSLPSDDVGDRVVMASFEEPAAAIEAALAGHRAGGLGTVRSAVHTGVVVMPVGDVGPTLDRGLALLAIAPRGQILVSGSTAVLVQNRLPAGAALVDRGTHGLHDLGRPEHVWHLSTGKSVAEVLPVRSLTTSRHNLPTQLTPLIGRRTDIEEVVRLVGVERLVTISGPGGVGKTRLAIAVAAMAIDRFPGGVWWVELAAVTVDGGAGRAALAVLGAPTTINAPVVDQIAAALSDEPSLLVLDNCEHLIGDCAELVVGVLAANPTATVLATSRELLGVPGEVTWRAPSLDSPSIDELDGAKLYRSAASRLFVDRALRAEPTLSLDGAGTRAVAEICQRLDGIPLAIELAAARCRHLDPAQIGRELDDRFRLLTGGARTAVARQQTMAASIRWSHDRLDALEQRTFRRLGVFTGTFPVEAARAVVAGVGDIDADDVPEAIMRLVDKSMLVAQIGVHGEPRYRLLETLRAYALERAAEVSELDELRDLNARWWASWLDSNFHELHTDDMFERVDEVHDNLVAALDWSVREPELGLFLLARLARAWWVGGRAGDGIDAMDHLLAPEHATEHPRAWVDAANFASFFILTFRGQAESDRLSDLVEHTAAAIDDEYQLVLVRWLNGDTELIGRIRQLAHQRGDRFVEALAVIHLSRLFTNDDPEHALTHLTEARAVAQAERSSALLHDVYNNEAQAARDVGELARGVALAIELADSRSTLTVSSGVWLLGSIGLLAMDVDALQMAVRVAQRRLPNLPRSNAELEQARTRLRALTEGRPAQATPQLEIIEWMNGSMWFVCREAIDAGEPDRALAVVRAQAPPTPFGRAVRAVIEGAVSGDGEHWHEALALAAEKGLRPIAVDALEGLAVAAARRESWTDCLRLFAAADRLRDETGYRWRFRFERERVEPARVRALAALGGALQEDPLEWHEAAAYAARARGRRQRPRHGWESLTPTELQVAELVAEGQTNPQIAQHLLMGRATVKTHLEHVFTKLGVKSRAELAARVVSRRQP